MVNCTKHPLTTTIHQQSREKSVKICAHTKSIPLINLPDFHNIAITGDVVQYATTAMCIRRVGCAGMQGCRNNIYKQLFIGHPCTVMCSIAANAIPSRVPRARQPILGNSAFACRFRRRPRLFRVVRRAWQATIAPCILQFAASEVHWCTSGPHRWETVV